MQNTAAPEGLLSLWESNIRKRSRRRAHWNAGNAGDTETQEDTGNRHFTGDDEKGGGSK